MSSERTRDPVFDQLLVPQNAASLVIDYQPPRVDPIFSIDRQGLINVGGLSNEETLFGLPVVDATNINPGLNEPASAHVKEIKRDHPKHDRANINNW